MMRALDTLGPWLLLGLSATALTWALSLGDEGFALPLAPPLGAPIDQTAHSGRDEPAPPPAVPSYPPEGTVNVDFEAFTFSDYDPPELRGPDPEPLGVEHYPAAVRPLDGRRVRLKGYPLAGQVEGGKLKSFLLSRYPPGCCFGSVPVVDEWVGVKLAEDGDESGGRVDQSIVTGVLELGERLDEHGYVESVYRMRDAVLERAE